MLKAGTQIGEIVPTKHVPQEVPEEKVKSAKESDDRAEELIKELRLDEKKLLNADPALKEKVKGQSPQICTVSHGRTFEYQKFSNFRYTIFQHKSQKWMPKDDLSA